MSHLGMDLSYPFLLVRCLAIPGLRTRISEGLRPYFFTIMKKIFTFIFLSVFCLNVINAEITWTLSDDGTLTISGTGDMSNYDYYMSDYNCYWTPWYSKRDNIKKVVINNGVTSIGANAFSGCSGLESITIPESVTNIGGSAFSGCSGLTSITIPKSVTSIGGTAFSGCSGLTSITIPESVTSIGSYAFSYCSSLTSFTVPESVTSIGIGIFRGCEGLTSLIVEKGNTNYDSRNHCNAIIETKYNTIIAGCRNSVIPNSVTSIGQDSFSFSGLTSITIPNSVTSIGQMAFYGCKDLTSITIPSSVTNMEKFVFLDCTGLTSIICEASTPPNCKGNCLATIDKSIPVYVPANSVEAYKNAKEWKFFTNIQAIPTTYTLMDGEIFDNSLQFDECKISYTRTFNNTSWQALYIPFSMSYEDWKDDFEVAYINSIHQYDKDDDGVIDETIMEVVKIKNGSLIPNTPYLIKTKTTGEKTITITGATLYESEENSIECSTMLAKYTFTGTYSTISASTLIANNYYGMGGGSLVITDGTSDLKPFRWYMKIDARSPMYNVSLDAKAITINVIGDEETTGVNELRMINDELPVYDLNGRKVNENSLKPGIYVKNGKKVIIK